MDIATIASLISGIASLLAIIGLWVELRRSRISLMTETALRLEERFYSPQMIATRKLAAEKLLAGDPHNHELSDVLDFYAAMVVLVERKAIDKRLVLDLQEYWLTRYYLLAKPYIEEARTVDPETWQGLGRMADSLLKKSAGDYSEESLQAFLREEARYGRDDHPAEAGIIAPKK